MSSSSTSHGYFDSVSTQLSLSVGSSFEGVAGNSSANASEGVSASVSAVDTGMKAGIALAGAFDAGMESAYVPALAGLGLKGMACLPISKQLDPVLGIDCHIMIPGGPLPNPYIGLLINPADFITAAIASVLPPPPPMPEEGGGGDADGAKMAGIAHTVATIVIGMMGATVKIGNFIPRAVAGTFTRNIFHFPIGGAFALLPMNKGHAFMGSLNVLADGDPLSGGGAHLHMDCWDIGIPTPHIIKKDKEYFALFMPTGIIIPIPWSRPVLTNPVPIPLNPVDVVKKKLMGAFGRFYKRKTERLARKLHAKIDANKKIGSASLKGMLHKALCTVTGHPVDVASGTFFTDEEDFFLTGVIPLSWERTWYSKSDYKGPLGNGWHHSYDMGLIVDEETLTFRMNDGRPIAIPLPTRQTPSLVKSERMEARLDEDGRYYIWDIGEDLFYHFTDTSYKEVRLLSRISDSNGFEILFRYDHRGHLQEITDSAGRRLRVENDQRGRITAIFAPDPASRREEEFQIASYRYDSLGNLIEQKNAEGEVMSYAYSGFLLVEEIWRNGVKWHFEYDGSETGSRCVHTWGTRGIYDHKLSFFDGYTEVLNSHDRKTTYYHKDGKVYLKKDPTGAEYRTRYGDDSLILSEQDPLGNSHLYGYDEFGNRTESTDPEGGTVSVTYLRKGNLRNRPLEVQTPDGGIWSFAYDRKGNVVERRNPKGAVTKLAYKDGLPAEITDAFGVRTALTYDGSHNLTEASDSRGNITRFRYDRLGRCTEITNPKGACQKRRYDLVGRIVEVEDFDGNHIRLTYDGIDNLLAYKDHHQEVEYGYEGMWKLTRRKDARGVICFLHDREERLLEIINEKGEHYAFAMDAAGNVLQEEGFDGGVRKYVRDRAGRVIKETLPSGKFKEYEYDRCGRVTRVTHDYDKAEEQTYDYYASGRLAEARNEHAIVSFRYDNMGLPVEERSNEHVIKRTYDKSGQIATLTSSLGADLTYERNEFGELTCFSAGQAEAPGRFESRHEYDSLGFELERMLPGGVTQSFAYDDIGRLIDSKTRQSSKVRRERKYHWGSADRLLKTEDNRFGTTTYEYSPTGHLQKAVYADGREEYRLSDKAGNLFDDPDRKLRKYLRGGKLEQSGEWRFVYDRDGQLVEKYKGSGKWWDSKSERWRYIWNQNGTLKEVRPPGGGDFAFDALFTYDALGRRLSKDAIGITCWLWNGNVPLHEWTPSQRRNEQGEIEEYQKDLRTWLFEEESFVPLALFQDGKAYSIVTDHLGTPVEAYNEKGEEVWYRRLDMNGKVIEERSMLYTSYKDYVRIPFLFQGQYYDEEIKLAYNRFRYYDPELGRYISQDPIRFESGTTTLYNYVEDPNIYLDVLGEYPSSINRHHLIPQEMFNDPDFMRQLKKIGIRDPKAYIHRQTADITELKHQEIHKGIHGGAWNSDFKEWYDRNSNFSKKELQQQLKKMMRNYNIPSSSRNFSRKYGRKPRKKSRKTIGYR